MATEPQSSTAVTPEKSSGNNTKSKLDVLYPLGLVGGVMALVGAALVDGTSPLSFLNLAALVIVVGGACSATIVQHPLHVVKRAMVMLLWAVKPPHYDPATFIQEILELSHKARRNGILSLEPIIDDFEDPFMRKGLQMAVDRMDTRVILSTMRLRLHTQTEINSMAAGLFEAAGGYAPTFGIMGAVTGLIEVMHHLSHPSQLGTGIAAAFVSTVYGLVLANVFCIPTANRLRAVIAEQVIARNVFLDGLLGIVRGTNSTELQDMLESYYLSDKKKEELPETTTEQVQDAI
ncbi:flagellar motor protein [Acidithiobacillus thiooxidans]|uniref:flagellar motor protein n=1 Tax=Acidithiobacillus thiooxidans TaxID=930 RepID=UPI001C06B8C5|nr:flagellar motor protein [Acidithiobacillus thiooxidans]MBU2793129.1 flagellar motor protein [Acidithiobacillus thiooxidans]